jgi:hypothetical protein
MQNNAPLSKKRQAVVVIHGVGDQRPMDTLRGFVETVLNVDPDWDPASGDEPEYYSNPDTMSDSFELRRLSTREKDPRTDFYEFYWQHLMPTAKWLHITKWLRILLRRKPGDVPQKVRGIWWLSWFIIAVFLFLTAWSTASYFFDGIPKLWLEGFEITLPFGVGTLFLIFQGIIFEWVGDAAIYLNRHPDNIEVRHKIRTAGISLLESLHKSERYDRIIIVGHSLGSVIGYDIITHGWRQYGSKHPEPPYPTRKSLKTAEKPVAAVARAKSALWFAHARLNGAIKKLRTATEADREKFLEKKRKAEVDIKNLNDDLKAAEAALEKAWPSASRDLWLEQRGNGLPWLVTDFITLGSPLSMGELLLARSGREFRRKIRQRELPVCPPQPEKGGKLSYPLHYDKGGIKRTVFVLHHAACFAHLRWINLYFPSRGLLYGDFVSGPLAPLFGLGIKDISVSTTIRSGLLSHTKYWKREKTKEGNPNLHIQKLRYALDLRRRSF